MAPANITWLGHASAVIDIGGERVLVDPLGRRRSQAVKDYSAVLVTHAHVDHLNRWTLAALDKSATLLVPKGATRYVADLGFAKVIEVEPGDHIPVGNLDIVGVPTRHDPGRWRKGDGASCTGFIVARDGFKVHHSGDVDISDYRVFDDIGKDHQLDATLLPIGGMLPVWYYRWRNRSEDRGVHVDPDTALHIAQRLGARAMVPVHWGTVNLRLGPPSAPPKRLRQIAEKSGVQHLIQVLSHGESLSLGSNAALPGPSSAQVVLEHPEDADDANRHTDDRTKDSI